MRRTIAVAVSAFLILSASLGTAALAAGAATWNVQAGSIGFGATGPDGRFGNAFYPSTILAHPGDTVVFHASSPHTVTFNRPALPLFAYFAPAGGGTLSAPGAYVNSGFLDPGDTFALHLGASLPAGSYAYLCSLHVGMQGRINVVSADAPIAQPNDELASHVADQVANDLALAGRVADAATTRSDDATNTVLAGAGTGHVTNVRFYPSAITIHVGESIEFLKTHDPTEPHTVSFGAPPPDEFAPSGPPPFIVSDDTSTVSTGILINRRQYDFYNLALAGIPQPPDRVSITFTRPGLYHYACLLHDDVGMRGTVNVLLP